jgi:hypothetical protein
VALSYALSAGEAQQSMDLTDEQWEVLGPLIFQFRLEEETDEAGPGEILATS